MTNYYTLDAPTTASGSPGASADRYRCCQMTEEQGHAPSCTQAIRKELLEATLREAGIGFRCSTWNDGEAEAKGCDEDSIPISKDPRQPAVLRDLIDAAGKHGYGVRIRSIELMVTG